MEQPTPWPRPWPGFASPLHMGAKAMRRYEEKVTTPWNKKKERGAVSPYVFAGCLSYNYPKHISILRHGLTAFLQHSVQMFSCLNLPSRCFGLKFHILSTCLGWSASNGILSWQGRHRQIAESLVYQAAGPSKDGWVWLSDGFANEAEHFLEERGPHLSMYSQSRHQFRHRPSRQRHLSFLACELPGWTAQRIWSGDLPRSPKLSRKYCSTFRPTDFGSSTLRGMVCHGQGIWPRLVWFCWGSCNVSGLHGGRPNPSGWLSASGRFRGLDSSDQKAREAAASHASQSHFCMMFPAHGSQSHPGSRQWHHR